MNISDYIIAQEKLDWAMMLEDWFWRLPASFTVWIVNRFGDLFITQDDGSVWMLDTSTAAFTRVANSREHFLDLATDADNFINWFMVDAVDDLVAAGHTLDQGQCYSYKQPPGLGGEYVLTNFMVTDLHVHLSTHGQIFSRTKDLPEGAPLKIDIE